MSMKKNLFIITSLFLFMISCYAQSAQPTQIKIFNPFTNTGLKPNLKVVKKVPGYCWTFSLRSNQPNAWRCMVGNMIQDPCFVNPISKSNTAVCVSQPWKPEVTIIQLTKPLTPRKGAPFNAKKVPAWFVDLANGDRCQFMTGATSPVNGMRINYACKKDTYIVGDLDSSGSVWMANYYQMIPGVVNPTHAKLVKVPVKIVWY